ncbi:unnamed protein product [Camellia sinensis]
MKESDFNGFYKLPLFGVPRFYNLGAPLCRRIGWATFKFRTAIFLLYLLVMCDAYTPAGEPIPTNKRYNAEKIFSHPDVVAEEPWYCIEQEDHTTVGWCRQSFWT